MSRPATGLDVLVPTCERPVELATTLAGLAAQELPFGLVVSDQSDGPASYDTPPAQTLLRALRASGHPVRTVRHRPRRGLAEHRASLLARSSARYVLFLDDDVWLEPGALARLHEAISALGCGLVGAAVQGLSYLDDHRPDELAPFERWTGPVEAERIEPGTRSWQRWTLHNAANPAHLAAAHLRPGERWVPYKIAWVGGCVLYDRQVLDAVGGFDFWTDLPEAHCGEDVLAQQRVMAVAGGAGILPSGAYHLESATTVPDRTVQARDVVAAAAGVPVVAGSAS
ncbi:glycosyltransferase family 2 protein [Pseudonocardia sp. MH-G8]|uniref:glycosyltransferase family 2 protein n=1 Tax=Pseudonocardia sp. MH-G8 TaxID=1854588 RepID=UPI000B9FF761|nr:glycosyltransferase family 2 protein [Pseudonocardia sp. MH-G8]OZM75952.1 glycosyl transferase [Pseudonocardia sp. MH-G8]